MRWLNLPFVLLINAVPLYGVKYHAWSVGTVLLLYWLENLLTGVFTAARIALHRKLTRKRGHWRPGVLDGKVNGERDRAVLLDGYIGFAVFFTIAQGLFAGAFVFLEGTNFPELRFSAGQFLQGAWQMLAVLGIQFVVDVFQLRSWSFAGIKAYAQQRMGRVVIMHLIIIFGVIGMIVSGSPVAIVYVLIGLKTLWDLAAQNATNPPAWLLSFAAKARKAQGTSEAAWQHACAVEQSHAIEDEQVRPEVHDDPARTHGSSPKTFTANDAPRANPVGRWALFVVGLFIAGWCAVGLRHGVVFYCQGQAASGKVIEYHAAQSRSRSIVGTVEVNLAGHSPFRAEVSDNLGSQNWEEGGSVALRCTEIQRGEPSCSADSGVALLFIPLLFMAIGLALAGWATRGVMRDLRRS